MSEFEKRLQEFFPEVYELHLLSKDEQVGGGGEQHIWDLIEQLLIMRRSSASGVVMVGYTNGKIGDIQVKVNVLAHKKAKRAIDNEGNRPL